MTKQEVRRLMKNIHGWLSEREGGLLYDLAQQCTGKGVIVEIGSWHGRSTIWLAAGSKAGKQIKVYAVDHHQGSPDIDKNKCFGDTYNIFLSNIHLAGVQDIVIPIRLKSSEAYVQVNEPVELLFIDGSHCFDDVFNDFMLWQQKVIAGGIIALHDVTYLDGPQKVAHRCILNSEQYSDFHLVDSILLARKKF